MVSLQIGSDQNSITRLIDRIRIKGREAATAKVPTSSSPQVNHSLISLQLSNTTIMNREKPRWSKVHELILLPIAVDRLNTLKWITQVFINSFGKAVDPLGQASIH